MITRDSHWTLSLNSVHIVAHLISKDFITSLMLTVSTKWPSPSWYTARNSAYISRLPLTGYISQHSHSQFFYVVRTVHFEMKLYNHQRNAQVFKNLFPYLLLPYMFWAFFKHTFKRHCVQIRQ
jgi:hypothetical protein